MCEELQFFVVLMSNSEMEVLFGGPVTRAAQFVEYKGSHLHLQRSDGKVRESGDGSSSADPGHLVSCWGTVPKIESGCRTPEVRRILLSDKQF